LVLSDDTIWVNISEELRMDIIRFVYVSFPEVQTI